MNESELVAARIKEAVGTESQRSFAGRAGISPTALRNYINMERTPKRKAIAAIADAADLVPEWVATGHGLKTRAELRAAQRQAPYQVGGEAAPVACIDFALLRQCLGACNIVYGPPFAQAAVALQLEHAVSFYNALLPIVGARLTLQDVASRDARGLADLLRGFTSVGLVTPWSP